MKKHEFIEDLFYKTRFDIDKLYILTYQCVFIDAKLVSLLQKEIPFSTLVRRSVKKCLCSA
jgi:hypothetical protein